MGPVKDTQTEVADMGTMGDIKESLKRGGEIIHSDEDGLFDTYLIKFRSDYYKILDVPSPIIRKATDVELEVNYSTNIDENEAIEMARDLINGEDIEAQADYGDDMNSIEVRDGTQYAHLKIKGWKEMTDMEMTNLAL